MSSHAGMPSDISSSSSSSWLRIIQINDVYELDNLSRLKTLIDHYHPRRNTPPPPPTTGTSTIGSNGPDHLVVFCVGDFLAPSLLSSLDQGAGMVDLLNFIGCTHVCLGNHETDIPSDALARRIREQSNFIWINTNMPQLNERIGVETPTFDIVHVHSRRVALLGLLTEDPSLYRPNSFAGATILPVLETALEYYERLYSSCDLIVPLTHQSIERDREMGLRCGGPERFPLILGGHDHEPYLETLSNGTRIIKTGMDAVHAAIIDIQWKTTDPEERPSIAVEMRTTTDFEPDPPTLERVQFHQAKVTELQKARLFAITDWLRHGNDHDSNTMVFSTRNNRFGPSTGTSALCSMLRMGMRCECAIINAGSVRANRDYDSNGYFTWSDLMAEIPFDTHMTAYRIPGRVLEDTITYSRRQAVKGIASGGYLHASRNVEYDEETKKIVNIMGAPFNPERLYLVALPSQFLEGIDNHRPLLDWVNGEYTEQQASSSIRLDEEAAIPAKLVIVQVFATLFWLRMGNFEQVSRTKEVITREDVKKRLVEVCGESEAVADLMVDTVFSIADMDKNGTISILEQMAINFIAKDMLEQVVVEEEMNVMKEIASHVLGDDASTDRVEAMATGLRNALDLRGPGLTHSKPTTDSRN